MSKVVLLKKYRNRGTSAVSFTKNELNQLLSLYSQRVINGEWKDYAINHEKDMSAFSIYRDTGNQPIFTIFKYATGTNYNGDYVLGSYGIFLKRGRNLSEVLSSFQNNLELVVS